MEIGKTYFVKEWHFHIRIVGEFKQFVFYAHFDNHHHIIIEPILRSELENLITEADYDEFEYDSEIKDEVDDFICFSLK